MAPSRAGRLLPVLAILLLAWLLRAWQLGFYDFRGDEVFGIGYVAAPLGQVIGTLARGEPHPPLFYLLLRSWIAAAGSSEYALRWLAAAGDLLAVALLYVLARRLAGRAVGLAVALLMALAPYHVWNAQDARMYTIATAFSTAAVYWAWRLLTAQRPDKRAAFAYAPALLLALYTHYYSIYMALLLNLFALAVLAGPLLRSLVPRQGAVAGASIAAPILPHGTATSWGRALDGDALVRCRLRLWLAAQAAVVLLYAPWVAFAWRTLTTYHGNGGSPSLGTAARDWLRTFALGWDLPDALARPLLPLYAAGLLLGLLCCARLRRGGPAALLLLLWLILPVGAIWLASRSRPIFDARYLIEASPPFYLLLALPAVWWRRRPVGAAPFAGLTVAVLLLPFLPALWALYAHPTDGRGHTYSALGRYLAIHAGAGDTVLVNHLDPVVRFYAQRSGVTAPLVTEPPRQGLAPAALNADLSQATVGKARVWFIPDDIGAWDGRHTVTAWLERHMQPAGQVAGGFHVIEFLPWPPPIAANVAFGPAIELSGYHLDPPRLLPGRPWQVVLFWRARAPVADNETVSVQLLDAAGRLVAQHDGVPHGGTAATSGWAGFETIPDPHALRLPVALPPGRYTLGVAVYPSGGGPRLPVAGAPSGLAPIATISVP